jgi:hypothetical protein
VVFRALKAFRRDPIPSSIAYNFDRPMLTNRQQSFPQSCLECLSFYRPMHLMLQRFNFFFEVLGGLPLTKIKLFVPLAPFYRASHGNASRTCANEPFLFQWAHNAIYRPHNHLTHKQNPTAATNLPPGANAAARNELERKIMPVNFILAGSSLIVCLCKILI